MPSILDAIDAIVYFDLQQGTRGLGIRNPKKTLNVFPGENSQSRFQTVHPYKTRLERVYEKKFEFPETQDGSICLRSINRAKRSGAEGP